MDPNNLAPANVSQEELPSGFTTSASPQDSKQTEAAAQQKAQKQNILAQALTPEALARLNRIKVRIVYCTALHCTG